MPKIIKKIKRKKRIITQNLNYSKKKIGYIFLSHKLINNTDKPIKLNITKFYHNQINNNTIFFTLYDHDIIDKELNTKKMNIKEKIRIFTDSNLELFIVIIDYNSEIKKFKQRSFFDMLMLLDNPYENQNDIYNNIYSFNDKYKCNKDYETNYYLCSENDDIKINIKDIYYYLIGYIKI